VTRVSVEQDYEVKDGRITSPGKYEGEPVWVPAYWDAAMCGCADDEENGAVSFTIDADDVALWPELSGVERIVLWQDEQGFVHSETVR